MVDGMSGPNNYKFEQVHVDWSGLRTQMIIGFFPILFLCLVNFILFCQGNYSVLPTSRFIDFTLYFASCSLAALISLEIGRVYGNRNGTGYIIWTALIFAISPWQSIICLPMFRVSHTISFFILLALLLWLRSQRSAQKSLALTALLIVVFCSICFETHHVTVLTPLKQVTISEYVFASLILCLRVFWNTLSWQTAFTILLCLINAAVCLEILTYPSLIVLAGATLAITLPIACLPTAGSASISINRLYGAFGIIVLASIAITYEVLFTGY